MEFFVGEWHPAPPPAYTPTPGYYGWLPSQVFPNGPNPNAVYMHDSPPPYPGIIPNSKLILKFIKLKSIEIRAKCSN